MSGVPDPPPPDVPVRAAGAVTPPVADNGAVESQAPAAAGRNPAPGPREVVILGSTGSIGTPALDIIRRHPDRLRVGGPAAGGRAPAPRRSGGVPWGAGGGTPELLAGRGAEFGVAPAAVPTPGAAPAV